MYNLKDLSDEELLESIEAWQKKLNELEYGESSAYIENELHVQRRELERRIKQREPELER